MQSIAISVSVYLLFCLSLFFQSVCSHISSYMSKLHKIFSTCYRGPWLSRPDDSGVRYVLPVLWITCFHIVGRMAHGISNSDKALCWSKQSKVSNLFSSGALCHLTLSLYMMAANDKPGRTAICMIALLFQLEQATDFWLVVWHHHCKWFLVFVSAFDILLPLVLWHCWSGVRKSIQPVKKLDEVVARLSV